jgi:hypothetical protein
MPPPNGIHVAGGGLPSRKRSGRNSSGDGNTDERRCTSSIDGKTTTPAGRS